MTAIKRADRLALDMFEGQWRLDRTINHADGTVAEAEGTAVLSPDGEGLTYAETGTLRIAGLAPLTFRQSYRWRAEGQGIAVRFDDGRPFHAFSAAALRAGHDCAPDRYDVDYGFDLPTAWRSTWRVLGPRKNYVMVSRYRR